MLLSDNKLSSDSSTSNKHTGLVKNIIDKDPYLRPYEAILQERIERSKEAEEQLTKGQISLAEFASGHEYFGLHYSHNEWVLREWAPNATGIYMVGEMTQWQKKKSFALKQVNTKGVWEVRIPADKINHGDLYRLYMQWIGGHGDRIPAYARRVVQDPETLIFNAQVWRPSMPYKWQYNSFKCHKNSLFIYEAHVGMAQEEGKVGSYKEFTSLVLPRIVKAGYNTLQLMAIQEHPYYGSFGYHVSSFFAASSRFGTPEDLKKLIDTAHGYGLAVIMDLVHSHAVSNEVEGLSRFDGTLYQYFHNGSRGIHQAWDSRCFDYGKHQVLHFLLSNCRFWLDEYRVDGFRFDGITSMVYIHHGLEKSFTSYDDYFDESVDPDALTYLALSNQVIHDVRPDAITIAEDISGMPGLAAPIEKGGFGFDYRMAMGVPDYWIKLIKEEPDENWPLGNLWHELNNRRHDEKTISYTESHDQALVGDKTLIFRLMDARMYHNMGKNDDDMDVDRGMALHKLLRLITMSTAGNGYLNFMGNEFGHPEWIDFPRKENGWSYHYARRQWHLMDDPNLKYRFLGLFDRDMLALAKTYNLLKSRYSYLVYENIEDKVIAFNRADLLFVFNFHPSNSHVNYCFEVSPGKYRMIFDSDEPKYGGHGRLKQSQFHLTRFDKLFGEKRNFISLYLPNRTALVLSPV